MKMRILSALTAAVMIGSTAVSAEGALLGDVNGDSVVNVRDCALLAHKLAENKAGELSLDTADYNRDDLINVRDAAAIAKSLHLNFSTKANHDLSTIEGIKDYVNDTISRIALEKYSVAEILPDDNVKSMTWYAPVIFLSDTDYYSEVNSVEEYGLEGIMPENYVTTTDGVIKGLEKNLVAISQREQHDGTPTDMSLKRLRIKWVSIGGGNFEVYLCYGGDY